jgi:hypothetical protein
MKSKKRWTTLATLESNKQVMHASHSNRHAVDHILNKAFKFAIKELTERDFPIIKDNPH